MSLKPHLRRQGHAASHHVRHQHVMSVQLAHQGIIAVYAATCASSELRTVMSPTKPTLLSTSISFAACCSSELVQQAQM